MGCRLHYATTYHVEWAGGYFNWNRENIYNLFVDNDVAIETNNDDEYSFEYCVLRENLKALYKKLIKKYPHPTTEQQIEGLPLSEVLKFLKDTINNADKSSNWIHLAWY